MQLVRHELRLAATRRQFLLDRNGRLSRFRAAGGGFHAWLSDKKTVDFFCDVARTCLEGTSRMQLPSTWRILVFAYALSMTAAVSHAQRTLPSAAATRFASSARFASPHHSQRAMTSVVSQSRYSSPDEPCFEAPATADDVLNSQQEFCEPNFAPQCQPQCYNYCCDPCRQWTFRAGAIFLHRQRPDNQSLISNPAIAGSGLNAHGFNPGWGTGVDASLIRHRLFGSNNDLELRYFGIDNWNDRQTLPLNGSPLVINTNPPTFITGRRDISSQYSLSLLNAEMNLRHRAGPRVTWIGGFRYLQYNEQLNTQLVNGPGVGDIHYNVAATNNLFGLQAGAAFDLFSSCDGCVQLYGKAGLYANQSSQDTSLTNFSAPAATFTANGQSTSLATVGEFGITGSRRIWRNLALRGGYQVLGLSGVATAPGQFPATSLINQSGLNNNDSVLFHGATVGLELTY